MEDKGSNKALTFLENTGLVQAYEYLLTSLCEHGLPTGDLYEFSALMVLKFEKKWKAKQRLNKQKPGQETSPVRKPEHEPEQVKHEDKLKGKEDKKAKDDKKHPKVEEDKKVSGKEDKKGKVEEKKEEKKGKVEEKKEDKNHKGDNQKVDPKQIKKEEEKKIAIEDKKEVKEKKRK